MNMHLKFYRKKIIQKPRTKLYSAQTNISQFFFWVHNMLKGVFLSTQFQNKSILYRFRMFRFLPPLCAYYTQNKVLQMHFLIFIYFAFIEYLYGMDFCEKFTSRSDALCERIHLLCVSSFVQCKIGGLQI